jgi:hypothetical protein
MTSSLYMILFIAFTLPSLIHALLHRKRQAELYKTGVNPENGIRFNRASRSYNRTSNVAKEHPAG